MPNPAPASAPPDAQFDFGLFSFTDSGVPVGGETQVELILPGSAVPNNYLRYGPLPGSGGNPQWYEWAYDGDGTTGAYIDGDNVFLHFVDGQEGDDDLTANGVIVDSGGPSFQPDYVVTNTNDSGPGSLRQAILDSNDGPGFGEISFDIPGGGVQTIKPVTNLPTITEAVTVDATTQPGYNGTPIIQLDGENDPGGSGIVVFAPYVTVRGFDINRFQGDGVFDTGYLSGSVPSNYPHIYYDTIVGNYIGTDSTGLIAEPNGTGVLVGGIGGAYFTVGGTTAADRNVISGNTNDGILIAQGNDYNVEGNYIGVGADGTTPLGNGVFGVEVSNDDYIGYVVSNVLIGGPDADQGNVIAYNYGGVQNEVVGASIGILSNSIYSNAYQGIGLGIPEDSNDFPNIDPGGATSTQRYLPCSIPPSAAAARPPSAAI